MSDTFSGIIKLSLPLLFLAFWACVSDIQGPGAGELAIDNFVVDYDQVDTKLFLQFENISEFEIDSAWVNMTVDETGLDTVFLLNDLGEDGDILPENSIFSKLLNIELEYLQHRFELNVISSTGQAKSLIKTLNNTELVQAEIENLYFWKRFIDGSNYKILDSTYSINEDDFAYLDFQVQIKDINGFESIQSIRYSLETDWEYAVGDSCNCPELECSFENPGFYFNPEPIFSNDSIFVYDIYNEQIDNIINGFINDLGFPISPLTSCVRYGTIKFFITVFDENFGPSTSQFNLNFTNCAEGNWNCGEECEACTSECGDCSE